MESSPSSSSQQALACTDDEEEEQIILQLSQVNAWLWISGFEASEDVPLLVQNGIKRVFNITPEKKSKRVQSLYADAGIAEQCFAVLDVDSANITSIIHGIAPSIQPSDRILIHCQAGISRSVSVAIGLMMTLEGCSLEAALDQIQEARSIACPNPGFMQQLETLERRFAAASSPEPRSD
jgi:atypical dual specificity phosphatase